MRGWAFAGTSEPLKAFAQTCAFGGWHCALCGPDYGGEEEGREPIGRLPQQVRDTDGLQRNEEKVLVLREVMGICLDIGNGVWKEAEVAAETL